MSNSSVDARGLEGLFEELRSAEIVNARMTEAGDLRTREVMGAVVRHLHAAIKEVEPTQQEWMSVIEFLTDIGKQCTDWRQEFILLSDVLGATMLVESINDRGEQSGSRSATPSTILGPFYVPGAPHYKNGESICQDGKGELTRVEGMVLDTNGNPVEGAMLDIWQTNNDGFYDVQQKGIQPKHNLRGVFTTGRDGKYSFYTVKPRHYPIPDDGPVGKLLKKIGRHPNRAAHIHFIVSAQGFDSLTTHIFAPDCPYLREDAVFGVKRELVADFTPLSDSAQNGPSPMYVVHWNFVLRTSK